MGDVRRVYVEKKEPFAVKARELKEEGSEKTIPQALSKTSSDKFSTS